MPSTPAHRIRVLQVFGASSLGGVSSFVSDLARDIDRDRFSLTACILDRDGPAASDLRALGVEVLLLPNVRTAAGRLRLLRFMAKHRFHLVHNSVGSCGVHVMARMTRCRAVVQHLHGLPDEWQQSSMPVADRRTSLARITLSAGIVVACSRSLASQLEALDPTLGPRLHVVHYGVRMDAFNLASSLENAQAARAELGIPRGSTVLGFVGRLVEQKGISNLLAVARDVLLARNTAHVVVVGDGKRADDVERFAREINSAGVVPRVHLLGARRDVPRLMPAFDVLVVPSAWEAFGIVNLEAMAAGRPVAAFAVDGIPEVVLHEETGLLAPPGDDAMLTRHILRLLDDPALRERLGRAGRARVEERFDARSMARRIEATYALALGADRG